MVGVAPYAIFVGFSACVALLVFSLSSGLRGTFDKLGEFYTDLLERADQKIKPGDFVLILVGVGSMLWVVLTLLMHPNFLTGALMLPLTISVSLVFGTYYLKFQGKRRVGSFTTQLEMVLRMMAGALRVGLGLRQSLILVTEELPNPARREFLGVIGRTNLGVSILDALDELAKSMPSAEMTMMARSIRVQSTTGGDLAHVLEILAMTIKDRRRINRKMSALTAQGRGGAWIIGSLPLVVGSFVMATQHEMAQALLHTTPGWIALGIVFVLEILAAFSLMKILQFDV